MRKLNNDGTPFIFEGAEVVRDFDTIVADNILGLKGAKWEKVEDSREVKSEPRPARVEEVQVEESQEAEIKEEEQPQEEAPKKKKGRPRK